MFRGDDCPEMDELLGEVAMECGVPSLNSVGILKDKGNMFFKMGTIPLAYFHYKLALKYLLLMGPPAHSDEPYATSLALSLFLNLAACDLKTPDYEQVCCYCTLILYVDPSNVKALYRRGLAFKHMNLLSKAVADFDCALNFNPHNKDISRELQLVADSLAINSNGKRESSHTNDIARKGKKPLLSPVSFADCVPLSLSEAPKDSECSNVPCEVVNETVNPASSEPSEITFTNKNWESTHFDPLGIERKGKTPLLSHPVSDDCAPVHSPVVPMDTDSSSTPDETLVDTVDCHSSSSFNSNSPHFYFTNKKRPHHKLNISSQDYENLLHGKHLGFYHPRSMSFMRVRTLTSKTIQTGTPHEVTSGTAEVPTSSPISENFLEAIQIDQTESVLMVQEEVVCQVDKKARLTSASSCVSKVSLVQFRFAAVKKHRGNLHNTWERNVCRSHSNGRIGRSTTCSKKRSPLPVGVSISFCRYTHSITTVTGTKRKEVQSIDFDAHYHRPFKKYCILSSPSSTVSSVSVFQVSSSSGVFHSPLFVI